MKHITKENFFASLAAEGGDRPWTRDYLVMYSTLLKGMVTDPDLMLLPIDDHLVHRGDGVFDVMRCVDGRIYQMEAHLKRLERSARAISLRMPSEYDRVREIIREITAKGGEKNCLIRVILSRGPGSFTTNPFDCPSSHMYINVVRHHRPPEHWYKEGIPVITSHVPIKKPFFAVIKSCDYLPNVLMKMDAIKAGCPYAIGLDEEGFLAEGSTENVGIYARDGFLKFPGLEKTLDGITLGRTFELAEGLVRDGVIGGVSFARILPEEAYNAHEMMLLGTSISVLPVTKYDNRVIGNGRSGPVCSALGRLLEKDMMENMDLLTEVDWEGRGLPD
jgi:branched-chain amino acid aminotransferase